MTTQHWKGPTIPSVGDDLVGSWPTMLDTAGIIGRASSVEAAIIQLDLAPEGLVTPANPAYFDIQSVVWRADGTKTSGKWNLSPINETKSDGVSYTAGETRILSNNQDWVIATSQLSAVGYDRLVDAWGICYGIPTAGNTDLEARIMGNAGQPGHWKTTTGEDTIVSSQRLTVPAGTDPQVKLVVVGKTQPCTITLGTRGRLQVTSWPISMS